VDSGAPQGNPADMPPPRQFADSNSWSIGTPDLIVSAPLLTVKAVGGDFHAPYVGSSPTELAEDRWISSFQVREFRPGEKQRSAGRGGKGNDYFVLHHQVISTVPPGETGSGEGDDSDGNDAERRRIERFPGSLNYVYEVGQNALLVPEDVGIALKAGAPIYFNSTHLHSIGKEVKFHTQVGFKFHPKGHTPKYPQGLTSLTTPRQSLGAELDIPGNTDNVRFDKFYVMDKPGKLVNFEPHLHASGKRMCVEVIYPSGIMETLNCAGYNHAWVKNYQYQDDVAPLLPKGTVLHAMGWYDNTVKNARVPDPRNWRGLGHRSVDDMLIFLGRFITFTEEEFKAEVAARAAKQQLNKITTTAQGQQ
jgi:hypothetical protein